MGLLGDSQEGGKGKGSSWGGAGGGAGGGVISSLIRRKQVDSVHARSSGHQLAKALSVPHLIAIGVGSTIGAGVYILVGTVAREHSGPALTISFLIAGIAAALSAFCYAELASRCPSAGSAYHYTYICVGEGVAWLVGWALILEYTIGGAAVARGISPNLALLFGGGNSLPAIIARQHIPGLDIVVDPCAAILVFIVTGLLCVGIKESTQAQIIVTTANVCAMSFVIIAGGYLGFTTGWAGYELPTGYFPFGVDGMLAGSATVFFAYIGFDSVASTAEEVKNPQRDLPLGIGASLFLCCALYMMVSVVVVGLVPYYAMDPDTPISSAFASHGMQWAAYIITVGTITALCSTLLGSILPQPRILMAMARDGLLPPFFSEVNIKTQVPMKGTIVTGIGAAILAFIMDVSQLAGMTGPLHQGGKWGMVILILNIVQIQCCSQDFKIGRVSVGTLLAFTMVAISVLILRYVPPDEVPLPSSLQGSIDSVSLEYGRSGQGSNGEQSKVKFGTSMDDDKPLLVKEDASGDYPLTAKHLFLGNYILNEENRRKIAGWTIMFTCVGAFLLTYAASNLALPRSLRFSLCGVGGTLLLSGLVVLTCIDQDDARHSFGHTGGFVCPFVPLLPIACILINVYLLINLETATWARVSIWLIIGILVYVFYGRRHSSLRHAVYVPAAHADEIYNSSVSSVA
ncbi:cationic amino acid transporter 2 [Quercus suber]|uniref:Cationic amino acid transporter 2 n=1 Tax=Quercus suber TaxID=58331 RepID=A0AAW0MAF8_QUESU